MWDLTQDLASSAINFQNDKHEVEVKPPLNTNAARPRVLIYRKKPQETSRS